MLVTQSFSLGAPRNNKVKGTPAIPIQLNEEDVFQSVQDRDSEPGSVAVLFASAQ